MSKQLLTFLKNNKVEILSYSASYEKPGKVPKIRYQYSFKCPQGTMSGETVFSINYAEAEFGKMIRSAFNEMIPNCWNAPHNLPI